MEDGRGPPDEGDRPAADVRAGVHGARHGRVRARVAAAERVPERGHGRGAGGQLRRPGPRVRAWAWTTPRSSPTSGSSGSSRASAATARASRRASHSRARPSRATTRIPCCTSTWRSRCWPRVGRRGADRLRGRDRPGHLQRSGGRGPAGRALDRDVVRGRGPHRPRDPHGQAARPRGHRHGAAGHDRRVRRRGARPGAPGTHRHAGEGGPPGGGRLPVARGSGAAMSRASTTPRAPCPSSGPAGTRTAWTGP